MRQPLLFSAIGLVGSALLAGSYLVTPNDACIGRAHRDGAARYLDHGTLARCEADPDARRSAIDEPGEAQPHHRARLSLAAMKTPPRGSE